MSNESKEKFEGTMIDLGEDLLESTRVVPSTQKNQEASPSQTSASLEDDLQHAEILMNERLIEDAKKIFRKVLRADPSSERARARLDEIQKREIQDLLGRESPRKRLGQVEQLESDDPAAVLERLEKELHISIEKTELKAVPDLFPNQAAFDRYRDRLLNQASSIPARERIDLGIAHLEMGLFDVAQAIFETVLRCEDFKISGMYLFGVALIGGGKAIEATIRLEPLARELTLSESQKSDFLYLMGLAFERLADHRKAREFYRRVYLLNPKYRDVVEKLK